jgi:hypothetical protein
MRTLFAAIICLLLSTLTACGGGNSLAPTYIVGGSLSGVAGSGLTLQLNGAAPLVLAADGAFEFPAKIAFGAAYVVTISSQPANPSQTCAAANASGAVANSNVTTVIVTCTTNTYTVGGTVTGLSGSGLILQDNAGGDLPVAANGKFSFAGEVASGSPYLVTIKSQPVSPSQSCMVANPAGTVATANVTSVAITCTTKSFTVGGSVSGLAGTGLALQLNGSDTLAISANGSFTFAGTSLSGSTYSVTIATQPAGIDQTCVLTNASGVVGASAVSNVTINCATNAYLVGGTITGLSGSGLALQLNGGQNLTLGANGSFSFPTSLASGTNYTVTIATQPTVRHEICVLSNSAGMLVGSNVNNVAVNCSTVLGFIYNLNPNQDLAIYGINPTTGAPIPLGSPVQVGANPTNVIAAPGGKFLLPWTALSMQSYVWDITLAAR